MQPIILAGGIGSRIWPISKPELPKQFIKISSKYSFFQQTLIRLQQYKTPIIIGNVIHLHLIFEQMKEIKIDGFVILEEKTTGTYIPMIFGSLFSKYLGNEIVGLFPTDHFIEKTEDFIQNINQGIKTAEHSNQIVAFGTIANYINQNYGHILATQKYDNIYVAKKFIEKPTSKILRFDDESKSDYFWNLGIFIFKPFILDSLIKNDIDIAKSYIHNIFYSGNFIIDKKIYNDLYGGSFDILVMNKLLDFQMVQANFDWIDIGSFKNIFLYYKKTLNKEYIVKTYPQIDDIKNYV